MSASLHFLSLTPQSLALHHSSSSSVVAAAPCLFNPASLKPLPNVLLSLSSTANSHSHLGSRFARRVALSSDVDEEEGSQDFSGGEEQSFSADLKLFVGNLPFNVDSSALAELFEQAGNVEMVEVIYDKVTGRSRGFGFVTMSTIKEVEAAAQQFNGYEFEGRALRVNYGPPPAKREDYSFGSRAPRGGGGSDSGNRVYVGNLAWGVDNLALETLFRDQGRVREARVVYDRESGRSRGFGFVTLSSPEEVNKAIQQLDGTDLDGRPIRVSPAEARPSRQY